MHESELHKMKTKFLEGGLHNIPQSQVSA